MTAPEAILAAMVANADILGPTPTGGAFLLVEVDNDVLGQLEAIDADEAEPDGDDEVSAVRVGGDLQPGDLAAYWPASPALIRSMVESGYGDRRAARLFGVHPATYRDRRRKLLGVSESGYGDGEAPVDPADYGFIGETRWPASARFSDDPRAERTGRRGRVPALPTHVWTRSATALCQEVRP